MAIAEGEYIDVTEVEPKVWQSAGNKFPTRLEAIENAVAEAQLRRHPPLIRIGLPISLIERGKQLGVNIHTKGQKPSHVLPTSNWVKSREQDR